MHREGAEGAREALVSPPHICREGEGLERGRIPWGLARQSLEWCVPARRVFLGILFKMEASVSLPATRYDPALRREASAIHLVEKLSSWSGEASSASGWGVHQDIFPGSRRSASISPAALGCIAEINLSHAAHTGRGTKQTHSLETGRYPSANTRTLG